MADRMISDRLTVIDDDFLLAGTSFKRDSIRESAAVLTAVFGDPCYETDDPREKIQMEWWFEGTDDSGETFRFSLYNWKDYDRFDVCAVTEWNVGARNSFDSMMAVQLLQEAIAEAFD